MVPRSETTEMGLRTGHLSGTVKPLGSVYYFKYDTIANSGVMMSA